MNLEELIPQYGEHDSQLKQIKSICDNEKEQIKSLMADSNLGTATYGGYKVTRTESNREVFDEVKAVEILKNKWASTNENEECPYIKKVEILDVDALESAIYANEIDKDTLLAIDGCRKSTPVITLKCSKVKGE